MQPLHERPAWQDVNTAAPAPYSDKAGPSGCANGRARPAFAAAQAQRAIEDTAMHANVAVPQGVHQAKTAGLCLHDAARLSPVLLWRAFLQTLMSHVSQTTCMASGGCI